MSHASQSYGVVTRDIIGASLIRLFLAYTADQTANRVARALAPRLLRNIDLTALLTTERLPDERWAYGFWVKDLWESRPRIFKSEEISDDHITTLEQKKPVNMLRCPAVGCRTSI
jgi:hypothetical protein